MDAAPRREVPTDDKGKLDLYIRENLDAELAFSPVTATWLGMHGYDDRLDDVRMEAQGREAGRLKALIERLRALDEDALDGVRREARLLLERRSEAGLFDITEVRALERNPVVYIDLLQASVFELVSDEGAPLPDRMRPITARLWKVRPLVDEARRNLRPQGTPELLVRRAIELGQAAKSFLSETLPKVLPLQDPRLTDDFRAAAGDATRALDDFIGWLQKDLLPRARGDFALGRERLMERLRLVEQVQATPELLLAIGERELKDARKRYDEAAKQVLLGKPGADLDKLIEEDHGKADDLQLHAQAQVEAMVAYLRDHRLVALPQPERPKVLDMPAALWGFVQLDMAGPLERPRDAYLYIDPVSKSWPERRKQEHLRAFNRPVMILTLLHEVPGHYIAGERNRRAPTTMHKIALAPSFVEGWPHYVERMMLAEGFFAGDPRVRLVTERSVMLRAARLVAAVKLHALGAKLEDAVKIFTDGADLDEYPARREAERAAADPMVLADALGRLEIERLRDDWRAAHEGASLGMFHDALLAHGSAPVAVIRRILLPDDQRSPL